ncbi:MAG TPA: hypothetical protein VFQ91_18060 [Bryobacteraceae bacterium]|nr:hypothetical protein [Bryobacteraceae bacterium]
MISRRQVLAGTPLLARAATGAKPKIAAVCTIYFKYSHTQHIVDRFLTGYGWNGTHHRPPFDLASLWVDQVGKDDLSRDRAKEFPSMRIYPSIAEALTLGTGKLAVDGVLLIGEHGRYERNEKRQTKYPRYEFFKEITKVFKDSGRSVPVFNDKHLSWNWDWAKEMYDTSLAMKFPMLAGSSLPVTWRTPSVEMPTNARVKEAVCVAYGGVDSYDFHALETLQCMVERRQGGESGVKWMQAYRGEAFWKAMQEGVWSRDLMNAALCRSHTLKPSREGFNNNFPALEAMQKMVRQPVAYAYEHTDGLRCTMILLSGLVEDFNFACRIEGRKEPFSTQMYLPMPPGRTTLANFFSPLTNQIERLLLEKKPPYPLERTLLTTGLTAAGVESLFQGEKRLETPHLARIVYRAPAGSTFWRS